jgi:uncharacterized protein (DUF934 family)
MPTDARLHIVDPAHDPWRPADPSDAAPAPQPGLLLSGEQWLAVRQDWPAELPVGVRWPNDQPVDALVPDLPRLDLIALHFPKWTDGRAYTQARLLRARWGYRGTLRATGDVTPDQALLLWRCGFCSLQLRPGLPPEAAQRALAWFDAFYQPDVRHPQSEVAHG